MDREVQLPRYSELDPNQSGSDARVVADAFGVRWRVAEYVLPYHWRGRDRRALIFETGCVLRTVADYPADWRALPEADLARVGEHA